MAYGPLFTPPRTPKFVTFMEGWMASWINTRSEAWNQARRSHWENGPGSAISDRIVQIDENIAKLQARKADLERANQEGLSGFLRDATQSAGRNASRQMRAEERSAQARERGIEQSVKRMQDRRDALTRNSASAAAEVRPAVFQNAFSDLARANPRSYGRGDWRSWWNQQIGSHELLTYGVAGRDGVDLGPHREMRENRTLPEEGRTAGVVIAVYEKLVEDYDEEIANHFLRSVSDVPNVTIEQYKATMLGESDMVFRERAAAAWDASPVEAHAEISSLPDSDPLVALYNEFRTATGADEDYAAALLALDTAIESGQEQKARLEEMYTQAVGESRSAFGNGLGLNWIIENPYTVYTDENGRVLSQAELAFARRLVNSSPSETAALMRRIDEYNNPIEAAEDLGTEIIESGEGGYSEPVAEDVVEEGVDPEAVADPDALSQLEAMGSAGIPYGDVPVAEEPDDDDAVLAAGFEPPPEAEEEEAASPRQSMEDWLGRARERTTGEDWWNEEFTLEDVELLSQLSEMGEAGYETFTENPDYRQALRGLMQLAEDQTTHDEETHERIMEILPGISLYLGRNAQGAWLNPWGEGPGSRASIEAERERGRALTRASIAALDAEDVVEWLDAAREAVSDSELSLDETELFLELDELGPEVLDKIVASEEGEKVWTKLVGLAYTQGMHSEEVHQRMMEIFPNLENFALPELVHQASEEEEEPEEAVEEAEEELVEEILEEPVAEEEPEFNRELFTWADNNLVNPEAANALTASLDAAIPKMNERVEALLSEARSVRDTDQERYEQLRQEAGELDESLKKLKQSRDWVSAILRSLGAGEDLDEIWLGMGPRETEELMSQTRDSLAAAARLEEDPVAQDDVVNMVSELTQAIERPEPTAQDLESEEARLQSVRHEGMLEGLLRKTADARNAPGGLTAQEIQRRPGERHALARDLADSFLNAPQDLSDYMDWDPEGQRLKENVLQELAMSSKEQNTRNVFQQRLFEHHDRMAQGAEAQSMVEEVLRLDPGISGDRLSQISDDYIASSQTKSARGGYSQGDIDYDKMVGRLFAEEAERRSTSEAAGF